jgi:hypothetical protein
MILQDAPISEILACEASGANKLLLDEMKQLRDLGCPETDKAAGAMAAMLRTIVKNAIERA